MKREQAVRSNRAKTLEKFEKKSYNKARVIRWGNLLFMLDREI